MPNPNTPDVSFSPKAIERVKEYVSKYNSTDSPTTVEDLCGLVAGQALAFERDFIYESPWFREQPVHDFEGFNLVEKSTDRTIIRQSFKLAREEEALLILAPEEVELPEEYYVQRVLVESEFPEYKEYAELKFQFDKMRRPPPPDTDDGTRR